MQYDGWIYVKGVEPNNVLSDTIFMNQDVQDAIDLANAYIALNGQGAPPNFFLYPTWYASQ